MRPSVVDEPKIQNAHLYLFPVPVPVAQQQPRNQKLGAVQEDSQQAKGLLSEAANQRGQINIQHWRGGRGGQQHGGGG